MYNPIAAEMVAKALLQDRLAEAASRNRRVPKTRIRPSRRRR